jgi:molecular chaperone GrpE
MQKKGSMLKYLDVFRITEEPEEVASSGYSDNVLERFELLKAEILKLGKSQLQARMFAKSEYQALRETIETLSANGSDPIADMLIEGLLSIADGLDAGIKAGREIPNSEVGSWLNGMNIVHQRVIELLEKFDVRPFHSVGQPFDPSQHTAVAVEYIQDVNEHIILDEQRRGYVCGDKVIRYAEVVVNKQPQEHAIQVEENDN